MTMTLPKPKPKNINHISNHLEFLIHTSSPPNFLSVHKSAHKIDSQIPTKLFVILI